MRSFHQLDAYLDTHDRDGYLIDADGGSADQRYLSGFTAPDPYVTCYSDGEIWLLVSELEYGRAQAESHASEVNRLSDYEYASRQSEVGSHEARLDTIAAFLDDHDVESVAVPRAFPIATADGLRDRDHSVSVETEPVIETIRAVKSEAEIDHIRTAQRANEAAMAAAVDQLKSAEIRDGTLYADDEPLTAEAVKETIEVTLLRHGHALDETIVAGGSQGADPHNRGSGPLPANEPIVIDIFPRSKTSGYYADLTRTVVRGEPDPEVDDRHRLTEEALEAALGTIEPGVSGVTVHDAACEVFEAAGYQTLRADPAAERGFIHNTGHGVGLAIHERPRLSADGGELSVGNVITVEPGLYNPDIGGMRIEDLVVVTETGYENLTDYPRTLTY